ncbi:hypothetical protein ASPACDRAFT_122191 [Aspergillus aculeatus ATCC 16872]|uniref:Zn(2)-C6 fungal-type domain-containing protein n=1 Tax=Aspergillus aculeatus (strain ATCC 16872 / CBS 172.66 / WB 5094) TaxID=690307 RepID=A0A1L9WQH5_ASPA1|nr:uncharacterized protein ASPACDRAFT_122191 [Aspergillus aculeatus ATCC 16872]OJJ98390.1 hypothetical protein ASPACDRAFT_122191 [Aspergillus aculeatus ATCC 16872]
MFTTKISKACQECRRRKIRCDGLNPCSTCQRRNTVCQFRKRARVRQRPGTAIPPPSAQGPDAPFGDLEEARSQTLTESASVVDLASPGEKPKEHQHRPSEPPSHLYRDVHKSVSAREKSSSSDSVELYYGPTSDFSLLQHLYRRLYIHANPSAPQFSRGDTDEVDQGLDFFRIRHIFFGPTTAAPGSDQAEQPLLNLPSRQVCYSLMNRFLATHYNIVPFYLKSRYDQLLRALLGDADNHPCSQVQKQIGLLAMATAAANTEHFEWGATVAEYCEAQSAKTEHIVSLETIQLGIMMAMYHLEYARSNFAYVVIGNACRKAFAAGLHRQQLRANSDDNQGTVERRHTFWSMYFIEIWTSFYLGRPSMLEFIKIEVSQPQDIFLSILLHFAAVMLKIVQQIYRPQCAPSALWNSAIVVGREMAALHSKAQADFGIELDEPRISDPRGMRPTVLVTLYNFVSLLIFRPFLIIRGKLQHSQAETSESSSTPPQPRPDIPGWLNDACHRCLNAAKSIILYICHIAASDSLLLELRFNCFYMENCLFVLLYDMASNPEKHTRNLPLIHEGLQFLTRMRPGDPVCSSITTIRRILHHLNLDAGPGELVQDHHHQQHSPQLQGFNPSAPPPPPPPPLSLSQMAMGPGVWEEQPQQHHLPLSSEPLGDPGLLAPSAGLQFDLDFSGADFNVDITAIDWGTFFSYVPNQ